MTHCPACNLPIRLRRFIELSACPECRRHLPACLLCGGRLVYDQATMERVCPDCTQIAALEQYHRAVDEALATLSSLDDPEFNQPFWTDEPPF